jgi:sugar phosphate isomerase/epimerase
MKHSFCTLGCPGWTIDEVVKKAKEYGYDGVELRGVLGEHIAPEEKPAEKQRIKALFDEAGVEVAALSAYTRLAFGDESQRAEQVRKLVAFVDLAAELGSPVVRTFGGSIPEGASRADAAGWIAEALNEVAPAAEAKGVLVALETHDEFTLGRHAADVLDKVSSPSIGICWDFANATGKETVDESFAPIAGRIHHVHVKDIGRVGDELKHVPVGQGEVPIGRAVELLKDKGYERYLSLEWEKKWKPELAPPEEAFPHYLEYMNKLLGS